MPNLSFLTLNKVFSPIFRNDHRRELLFRMDHHAFDHGQSVGKVSEILLI